MQSGQILTLADICTPGNSLRRLRNSSSSFAEHDQSISLGRCQMRKRESVFLSGTFVCKHHGWSLSCSPANVSQLLSSLPPTFYLLPLFCTATSFVGGIFWGFFVRCSLMHAAIYFLHFLASLRCLGHSRGWARAAKILTNQGAVATAPKHLTGAAGCINMKLANCARPSDLPAKKLSYKELSC